MYLATISAVRSVEPSSTMIHRSGRLVWTITDLIVPSMKFSSFLAGVIKTYFILRKLVLFPISRRSRLHRSEQLIPRLGSRRLQPVQSPRRRSPKVDCESLAHLPTGQDNLPSKIVRIVATSRIAMISSTVKDMPKRSSRASASYHKYITYRIVRLHSLKSRSSLTQSPSLLVFSQHA